MKLKLKGRELICADIKSPEMIVGKFNDSLIDSALVNVVINNNSGEDVYTLYRNARGNNMTIHKVKEFFDELQVLYFMYETNKRAKCADIDF